MYGTGIFVWTNTLRGCNIIFTRPIEAGNALDALNELLLPPSSILQVGTWETESPALHSWDYAA